MVEYTMLYHGVYRTFAKKRNFPVASYFTLDTQIYKNKIKERIKDKMQSMELQT